MSLWEFLGWWSSITKGLYHLNGNGNDSSWNWNNWTATNVTWVAWRNGSWAASFNWSSSKITASYTPLNFERTDSWTILLWAKPTSLPASDAMFYCHQASWGTYQGYNFRLNNSWQLLVNLTSNYWTNNYLEAASPSSTVVTWSWNLYAYTYNWNSNTSWITFYKNWVALSTTSNFNSLSATIQTTNWITIWNRNTESLYYNWLMDELIIENRAWSSAEVKKYYTYSKWRFGIN